MQLSLNCTIFQKKQIFSMIIVKLTNFGPSKYEVVNLIIFNTPII
jgi:hypothetical protein